MRSTLTALTEAGMSLWLDGLDRDELTSASLATLVSERHVSGVVTNPSALVESLTCADSYRAQLQDLVVRRVELADGLRELAMVDVRWACDVLRPVYDATDGVDGRVSIEVDPWLADDAAAVIAEARLLWWAIDRPNLLIKVFATRQGLAAITALLSQGISVNAGLICSRARHELVMQAVLTGLEQARQAGRDVRQIASVASVLVSRVDREVDTLLDDIGTEEAAALRGRTAIANAWLAYRNSAQMLSGDRWRALQRAGAHPQRLLWESTSATDLGYPDTRYVVGLAAPGVVSTVSTAMLRAVADQRMIRPDSVQHNYVAAREVFDRLAAVGIDYDNVVARRLEGDEIVKRGADWDRLADQLAMTFNGDDARKRLVTPAPRLPSRSDWRSDPQHPRHRDRVGVDVLPLQPC